MRSNIDGTRRRIESMDETENVTLDGDTSEVIVRAMIDGSLDAFEDKVESLSADVGIESVSWTPYGLEVELR
jgi:translation initiation factor IF-2